MKKSIITIALLSVFAITNSFASDVPVTPFDGKSFEKIQSEMNALSSAQLFLEEFFADQNEVSLPGMNCIKVMNKTKTEVVSQAADGGVYTQEVPYGPAFKCDYTN